MHCLILTVLSAATSAALLVSAAPGAPVSELHHLQWHPDEGPDHIAEAMAPLWTIRGYEQRLSRSRRPFTAFDGVEMPEHTRAHQTMFEKLPPPASNNPAVTILHHEHHARVAEDQSKAMRRQANARTRELDNPSLSGPARYSLRKERERSLSAGRFFQQLQRAHLARADELRPIAHFYQRPTSPGQTAAGTSRP